MNRVQQFIDHLTVELTRSVPGVKVEAREPAESELAANANIKQIFITTEGIELPDGSQIADLGLSSVVSVPVMVACVMPRPATEEFAVQTLRRRLQVVQAVQRACRTFCEQQTGCVLNIISEQPNIVEGYFVSVTGIEVEFDLLTEENL